MKKFKIAVVQFQPKFLQVKENLAKIGKMCANLTADLVVLPELATCGYAFASQDEVQKVAEKATTGASAVFFDKLAKTLCASVVYGFPELKDGKIFNSARLVNQDGSSCVYQKIHLFNAEKLWFAPGESGLVIATAKNDVKVGLMICFDWFFPEVARSLALQGAQILCQVANLVLPWCQQAMLVRSLENACVSVTANRVGDEKNGKYDFRFTGGSQVVDHLGKRLGKLGENEEGILIVEVDLDQSSPQLNSFNNIFADRKPQFYRQ